MASLPLLNIGFLVLFPLLAAGLLLLVRNDRGRDAIVMVSGVLIMLGCIWLAVGYFSDGSWKGSISDGAHAAASAAAATAAASQAAATAATAAASAAIGYILFGIDIIIGAYILVKSIKYRKPLAGVLAVAQVAIIIAFELGFHAVEAQNDLYIDGLSVIMALVIGIIGSGICIYALGYMKDFQKHSVGASQGSHDAAHPPQNPDPEAHAPSGKDRRPLFFALMFLFLSAMFAIVFANNLSWLLCAWEVTTVCSFALIGYTRTKEAINNSFRQIVMNLLGGLAFAVALLLLANQQIIELDKLISLGSVGTAITMLPILLLAFAGMTKAAQVPFQSWLLGAMVAPTPTSALLHSSTMVKAGVFMVIKLAPTFLLVGSGIMVMLVGALTFLFCSAMAISQSNAKRVLAYSTVANLGLIVACAGVGTPEAVWAAIFLLVFHAAAKSLLFLCVGTAEHHIDSRDIEDMDNLFIRMPKLARLMALGILTMFIAPFGMLISKWATIVSLVETNNLVLLVILAFGSAVTFMFWAKWLGKLLGIAASEKNLESSVHKSEWATLALMAVLVVAMSIGFPFVSEFVVVPYLADVAVANLPANYIGAWGADAGAAIGFDNLVIMAVIVAAVLLLFLLFLWRVRPQLRPGANTLDANGAAAAVRPDGKAPATAAPAPAAAAPAAPAAPRPAPAQPSIYLSGVGLDSESRSYRNSLSGVSQASQRNWYMDGWFSESRLTTVANSMCIAVMAIGLVMVCLLMTLGWWF